MKELKVINAVLINKDVDTLFGEGIDEMFVAYGDVWSGIKQYYNKHHEVPAPSVMKEAFPEFEVVEVEGAVGHYVDGMREEYIQNRLSNIFLKGSKLLKDYSSTEVLVEAQAQLQRLHKYSGAATDHNIMDFDAAEERYAAVRERVIAMNGTPGIPSGIKTIDSAYPTGFAPGDLIIALGYTGRKKSYFTALLACNAYNVGFKPMMVSLEMGPDKVQDRIYTTMGSGLFENSALALGDIDEDDFNAFRKEHDDKGEFIVVNGDGRTEITPNILQAKIDQHKPDLLIVDYAQLMSDNNNTQSMVGRMLNLSQELKRLAVANQIPIILISSATADGKVGEDPPTIEQVAWSRQLAFDADLAFAVHGHDDSDLVSIVCRKNRNGAQFNCQLDWDINRGIYEEVFLDA